MARQQDFRNLNDYVLAVRVLRKFSSDRFTAAAGYDLRKWRDISDIPKKEAAKVRKYYRSIRPLLVYGYTRRKVSNKKSRDEKYKALYGVKPLPGIDRIPLPISRDGVPNKVKFVRDTDGGLHSSIEVSPGIHVIRLTWAQMGYGWDEVTGEIDRVMDEVRERYQPDYIGIIAGHSRVKRQGRIGVRNAAHLVAQDIRHLMSKYGAGGSDDPDHDHNEKGHNHNTANWLDGLELYYFRPPIKTGTPDKRKKIQPYLNEEEQRYKERNKLARSIKNKNATIKREQKKLETIEKTIAKRLLYSEKQVLEQRVLPAIRAGIKKHERERDQLIARLHLTKGF